MDEKNLETICIIENASTELYSYLKIANSYIWTHCYDPKILHIGLLIDKMTEHIENLHELFDSDRIKDLINNNH